MPSAGKDSITFKINGRTRTLSRKEVEVAMRGREPESVRSHAVVVAGRQFPVKQVFAIATGLDRLDFTSEVARRHLDRLGFELSRSTG